MGLVIVVGAVIHEIHELEVTVSVSRPNNDSSKFLDGMVVIYGRPPIVHTLGHFVLGPWALHKVRAHKAEVQSIVAQSWQNNFSTRFPLLV